MSCDRVDSAAERSQLPGAARSLGGCPGEQGAQTRPSFVKRDFFASRSLLRSQPLRVMRRETFFSQEQRGLKISRAVHCRAERVQGIGDCPIEAEERRHLGPSLVNLSGRETLKSHTDTQTTSPSTFWSPAHAPARPDSAVECNHFRSLL